MAYLLTVFLLITLNFFLPRLMPGDPIEAMLATGGNTTSSEAVQDEKTRTALARYYGLDRPLLAQYEHYLARLFQGDLGISVHSRVPVRDLLAERLPWTALLGVTAVALAALVGLPAGIHSGWRHGRASDRALLALFMGLTVFVVFDASVVLFVFAVKLGWVPVGGAETLFSPLDPFRRAADIAHHLLLPAVVLSLLFSAGMYLLMRAGIVGELGADYLVAGRAKGLGERRLEYGYAGRNALLPVTSQMSVQLASALTVGPILVETVFAYPGLGRLLAEAVGQRDYPVMQGCFLLITLATVTLNMGVEALYGRLDPRTRP